MRLLAAEGPDTQTHPDFLSPRLTNRQGATSSC